jgi:hypothetical protein
MLSNTYNWAFYMATAEFWPHTPDLWDRPRFSHSQTLPDVVFPDVESLPSSSLWITSQSGCGAPSLPREEHREFLALSTSSLDLSHHLPFPCCCRGDHRWLLPHWKPPPTVFSSVAINGTSRIPPTAWCPLLAILDGTIPGPPAPAPTAPEVCIPKLSQGLSSNRPILPWALLPSQSPLTSVLLLCVFAPSKWTLRCLINCELAQAWDTPLLSRIGPLPTILGTFCSLLLTPLLGRSSTVTWTFCSVLISGWGGIHSL